MRRFYFLLIVVFLISHLSIAQKAKYHGDLVYRLAKHITWSGYNNDYKFIIGVVGNIHDFQDFQAFVIEKGNIHQQTVEVRYFECTDNIDECDLVYISESCTIGVDEIVKKTKDEPILIVSGKNGYGQSGSVINFVEIDGKVKIELNQVQARQRGLLVSDDLKRLAIVI